ncbi:MAG: DUF3656 domain-containing protein [Veillonellaceae bacterium]|nr:DUF3656 domain-containing protein [Veillonellaceae bacterium]
MELLAPAGSIRHLRAALDAGADAVYLGGKSFNARRSAVNFTLAELAEATELCHVYAAAVYVTLNILLGDSELQSLAEYVATLERIGVDAVIVQDIGVAEAVRRAAPALPLHASTQMTVSDLAGVRFLATQGFTRVVLARELSLAEVCAIARQSPIEIEVFIHGAICVSYSGQCLMSSMAGARSGNRGACAQPCRLPYELVKNGTTVVNPEQEKYILSPKDMISAAELQDLAAAGVASLKIEGRMKEISYVRQVVGTYRELLAGSCAPAAAEKRLANGFNRGFTEDYWHDTVGRTTLTAFAPNRHGRVIGKLREYEKSSGTAIFRLHDAVPAAGIAKYVTQAGGFAYFDLQAAGAIRKGDTLQVRTEERPLFGTELYWQDDMAQTAAGEMKHMQNKIPLRLAVTATIGEPLRLRLTDPEGNTAEITADYVVPAAKNRPTDVATVREQLQRLGNTPFALAELTLTDGEYMLPKSVLNGLRTAGIARLTELRRERYEERRVAAGTRIEAEYMPRRYQTADSLSIRARSEEEVRLALAAGVKEIIYGGDSYDRRRYRATDYCRAVALCREYGAACGLATPRIVREKEAAQAVADLREMIGAEPDFLYIHSYGDLQRLHEAGTDIPFVVAASLNVFNAAALKFWRRQGASRVTLSQELNYNQIAALARSGNMPVEVFAAGRTEVMVTENCVINAYENGEPKRRCPGSCRHADYVLRDRLQQEFPLVTDQFCRLHILNSYTTDILPYAERLRRAGVAALQLDAGSLPRAELHAIIAAYREEWRESTGRKTAGSWRQFTRGHLNRGIV